MPDMPEGPIFEWRRGLPILPPVADDDTPVADDEASISESVTSANAATPPTLYVDDDRTISLAHTDTSDVDHVQGANDNAVEILAANEEAIVEMSVTNMPRKRVKATTTRVLKA